MQSSLPNKTYHQAGRAKQALLYIKEFLENYGDEKLSIVFILGFLEGCLSLSELSFFNRSELSIFN
jgi:hypothetical protein